MLSYVRKILALFEQRERWELARIFGLTLVSVLVQTVGVASLLPFMSLVSDPTVIQENRWTAWAYESFGFESSRAFLFAAGLAVLAITAISNGLSAFNHYLLVRFLWSKQYKLGVRLLRKYLHQPYVFHLDRNSAGLAKNILSEVGEVINGLVVPGMRALVNTMLVLSIFAMLLYVDPVLALVSVSVLGGFYGIIYAVVKRKQVRLGRKRREANDFRFKAAGEALGAIKEIKVLGRESELLERFARPARRYSGASAANSVVSDIPRYAVETLAFGGIILVMLFILSTRQDFGQAVAVVSLYAMAGYRLIPALQNIFHGLARYRFFSGSLDHLHRDLMESSPSILPQLGVDNAVQPLAFEREIRMDGTFFRYPERSEWVLQGIDLRIVKNTTIGLVGSTGSGKTTLVDIVLGLLTPEKGLLRVDGLAVDSENIRAWQRNLGYVPQHIFLSDDTVSRNIAFGVPDDEIDTTAVEHAARLANIHDFLLSLPNGYDTIVGERGVRLSGGQRQRIGIARALYRDPSVLILDEATSALDGITEDVVMEAISTLSQKKTIILVAHRISTLRDCDRICLMEDGHIIASGTFNELMLSNQEFRAMAKLGAETAVTS